MRTDDKELVLKNAVALDKYLLSFPNHQYIMNTSALVVMSDLTVQFRAVNDKEGHAGGMQGVLWDEYKWYIKDSPLNPQEYRSILLPGKAGNDTSDARQALFHDVNIIINDLKNTGAIKIIEHQPKEIIAFPGTPSAHFTVNLHDKDLAGKLEKLTAAHIHDNASKEQKKEDFLYPVGFGDSDTTSIAKEVQRIIHRDELEIKRNEKATLAGERSNALKYAKRIADKPDPEKLAFLGEVAATLGITLPAELAAQEIRSKKAANLQ